VLGKEHPDTDEHGQFGSYIEATRPRSGGDMRQAKRLRKEVLGINHPHTMDSSEGSAELARNGRQ